MSFCVAPWKNFCIEPDGFVRPCCYFSHDRNLMPYIENKTIGEIYNSQYFKDLRNQFLKGEKPDTCKRCWDIEQSGSESHRIKHNNIEKFDINEFTETAEYPTRFDLKLSNICNLKCRNCNGYSSSLIEKEEKKFTKERRNYLLSNKILGTRNEKEFIDYINNITFIELTGGEPFVSPENRNLIFKLAELDVAKNIHLAITTNGTTFDRKIIENLNQFKKVDIAFSLDDIYERAEYARHGHSFDSIVENLKTAISELDSNKIKLRVHNTVGLMNIYYLTEFIEFMETEFPEISYGFSPLDTPAILNVKNLSPRIKSEIFVKLYNQSHKLKEIIKYMLSEDSLYCYESMNAFLSKMRILDLKRKESFEDTYPEWYTVLEKHL